MSWVTHLIFLDQSCNATGLQNKFVTLIRWKKEMYIFFQCTWISKRIWVKAVKVHRFFAFARNGSNKKTQKIHTRYLVVSSVTLGRAIKKMMQCFKKIQATLKVLWKTYIWYLFDICLTLSVVPRWELFPCQNFRENPRINPNWWLP